MTTSHLSIGDLAHRSGVPITTLRYYDRIGLLPAGRTAGGRRAYPESSVDVLALVDLCRLVGCSLEEVGALLRGDRERRELAGRKLGEARAQQHRLSAVVAVLDHLAHCRHPPGSTECLTQVRSAVAELAPVEPQSAPVSGPRRAG